MNKNIKNFINTLKINKLDAFLVTNEADIRYLTGYKAEDAWLLVSRQKVFYITDGRYADLAKKSLKGISVQCLKNSLIEAVFESLDVKHAKRLGFDSRHVTHFQYKALKEKTPNKVALIEHNGLVGDLRTIKSKDEILKIKQALALHQELHQYLKALIKPGVSESGVALKLEAFLKSRGACFSFSPIVASGPNSSYPHAKITSRKFRKNDVILVDIGVCLNGYNSDLTRMFFLGRIPRLIKDYFHFVQEVQKKAIEEIRDGVPARSVDELARNILKERHLEKLFVHSLGHGVGLEVHEAPRLSLKSKSILKTGMVVTVEPGVYVPRKFGIRIEDMVLVTRKGVKVLSDNIH